MTLHKYVHPILKDIHFGCCFKWLLILGWKYVDGAVGLYSSLPANKQDRPPWGGLIGCKFKKMRIGDNMEDHFVFENRKRDKRAFWISELNPLIWTVKILELRLGQKNELLAMYLQLILCSEKFRNFKDGIHTEKGFRIDGSDITVLDLESKGGSMDEYEKFLALATGDKFNVPTLKSDLILKHVEGSKKRKVNGESNQPAQCVIKKCRKEVVEDARNAEIEDEGGVEKAYVEKFIWRGDLSIDILNILPFVKYCENT